MKFRVWDVKNDKAVNSDFVIYPDGKTEFPESGWDLQGWTNDNEEYRLQYTLDGNTWIDA